MKIYILIQDEVFLYTGYRIVKLLPFDICTMDHGSLVMFVDDQLSKNLLFIQHYSGVVTGLWVNQTS